MADFQHIAVGDRIVRVSVTGDLTGNGTPIVYLHGGLGSIVERPASDELLARLAIRLVRIERPGFGASSRHPGRTLAEWAGDVRAVLDALGLARVGLLGWSGGTPHALAVAALAPERVAALALVGAMAPSPELLLPADPEGRARATAEIAARAAAMAAAAAKAPEALRDAILGTMPEIDRALPDDVRAMLAASYAEALRSEGGAIDEMIALRTAWPFALTAVTCPVQLWVGEHDRNTPPAGARQLASALPRAWLEVVANRGHNLIFTDAETVLAALRDAVAAAA